MVSSDSAGQPAAAAHYRLKRRVTLVGAAVNVVLAAAKVVVGLLVHSQALVADGVHSLSDLVSDLLVLAAARFGSKEADADHPYGHGRFETVATLGVGVVLIAVAAGFVYDAVQRLMAPEALVAPGAWALVVALAAVLAKELLYQYTMRAGRRVRSKLIQANAWHHRSDALSSVVVLGGIIGARAGFPWLDAVAAIVVAVMVAAMGWQFVWDAIKELVDTAVDPEELAALGEVIESVEGVHSFHRLRTRHIAGEVLVDVHILVDRKLTVSEGHRIADEVQARLLERVEATGDVLVHVDVEQEPPPPRGHAPLRRQLLRDLRQAWGDHPELEQVVHTVLHYHRGHVQVEVLVPAGSVPPEQLQQLSRRLEAAAAHLDYVERVRVLIAPEPAPPGEPHGAGS